MGVCTLVLSRTASFSSQRDHFPRVFLQDFEGLLESPSLALHQLYLVVASYTLRQAPGLSDGPLLEIKISLGRVRYDNFVMQRSW